MALTSFRIAGQFQSGRRAFLAKKYEDALKYFQQVAQSNPDYIFVSGISGKAFGPSSAGRNTTWVSSPRRVNLWNAPSSQIRMIVWLDSFWV
jgi:hypothetical protein